MIGAVYEKHHLSMWVRFTAGDFRLYKGARQHCSRCRKTVRIERQSGNTGEAVTNPEIISKIADLLSLEFQKGEKSGDSTGWRYCIRWYDADGRKIDMIVVMNNTTIKKNGYFYTGSIDLSLFEQFIEESRSIEG